MNLKDFKMKKEFKKLILSNKNLTNILFILLFITFLKLLFNLNRSFYFDINNNNTSKIITQENL